MSLNDYPTSLKPIVPYIQRANEFEKRAPIVSFYCRTYAAQLGISIIQSQDQADDEATNLLTGLMDQLEQDKEQLNIEAQEDEAKGVVEVFALKVFKKADDADRAGRHDTQIAKLYYAASILIEVTKQFGELSSDMMEKQKYAKWRAAEIQKSVRTGQPVIPVTSEETAEEEDDQLHYLPTQTTTTNNNDASNDEDEVTKYLMEQQRLLNLSSQQTSSASSMNINNNIPQPSSWNFDNIQRDDAMKISPTTEEPTFPSWNQPSIPQPNNNMSRSAFNTSPVYEPQRQVSPPTFVPQQQYQQPTQPTFNQPPPQPPQQFVQPPVFTQPQQQYQQPTQPTFNQPPPQPVQQQPKPVSTIPKPVSSSSPISSSPATPTSSTYSTTTQPVLNTNGPKREVTLDDMMKAQKLCKFAISSLQFEDVDTARKNLMEALNLLN